MLDRPTPNATQLRRPLTRAPPEPGARARVAEQASKLFCEHVLQDVLVEAEISHKLLELTVLDFELLQPPQFARPQAAVQLLSAVECLLGDAHSAQHFRDRRPGLGLLQRESDLLFGEPALLHGPAPPVRVSQSRKARTQVGPKRWRTSSALRPGSVCRPTHSDAAAFGLDSIYAAHARVGGAEYAPDERSVVYTLAGGDGLGRQPVQYRRPCRDSGVADRKIARPAGRLVTQSLP